MYVLWYAVNAKRTTVYVSDTEDYGYIFYADGRVEAFLREDLHSAALAPLDDPVALLIFDGDGDSLVEGNGRPPNAQATIVFVTSPKRSCFKEFAKSGVKHFGFPVLSKAEMSDMLESCFPNLHSPEARKGVWERYDMWGGIPRYVFYLLGATDQKDLGQAMKSIDLSRVADLLRKNDFDENVPDAAASHRLFHLKPVGETADGFEGGEREGAYEIERIELGSYKIKEAVLKAVQKPCHTSW